MFDIDEKSWASNLNDVEDASPYLWNNPILKQLRLVSFEN